MRDVLNDKFHQRDLGMLAEFRGVDCGVNAAGVCGEGAKNVGGGLAL